MLESGVPAWTANIMFDINRRRYELIETGDESWAETQRTLFYNGGAIPHWSVGRLIELLVTCAIDEDHVRCIIADIANYAAPVETYVNVITYLCKIKELDFSKSEE